MIRQAHTYLAGALSGTAVVAAAVVAFVVLVSLQAIRDWPLQGLVTGTGANTAASSPAHRAFGATGPAPEPGSGREAATEAGTGSAVAGPVTNGAGETRTPGIARAQGGSPSKPVTGRTTPGAGQGSGGAAGGSGGGGTDSSVAKAPETASGATGVGSEAVSSAGSGVKEAVAGVGATATGVAGAAGGGVGHAVEGTVGEVVGLSSGSGGTVTKTVEAVGGLLGGGR